MYILSAPPFLDSFIQADWLGKAIYLCLFSTSVICWVLLIQKALLTRSLHQQAMQFTSVFQKHKKNPLSFDLPINTGNPFHKIYSVLKRQTLELLNKNRHFAKDTTQPVTLSPTDIDFIESHVSSSIIEEVHNMEKNLYILSTIVTLAPFLGLLGTVWGILVSFSDLQGGVQSQMVLGGLSLALTTTVLGLIIAIPALIGNNYLRNAIKVIQNDMESFSNDVMASVELQYRQVDAKHQ